MILTARKYKNIRGETREEKRVVRQGGEAKRYVLWKRFTEWNLPKEL